LIKDIIEEFLLFYIKFSAKQKIYKVCNANFHTNKGKQNNNNEEN